MANIEGENGGDPTNAVGEGIKAQQKSLTKDAVHLWYQESTEWLNDAAKRRSELGERHGREGRSMNNLSNIRDESMVPTYENGRWVFSFPHEGAVFQEYGARPHEIRAKKAEVLAFQWPDAPSEVQERFEHTEDDLVFFESVNHPGIPAIGFVRYGRREAKQFLEARGYSVQGFTE